MVAFLTEGFQLSFDVVLALFRLLFDLLDLLLEIFPLLIPFFHGNQLAAVYFLGFQLFQLFFQLLAFCRQFQLSLLGPFHKRSAFRQTYFRFLDLTFILFDL